MAKIRDWEDDRYWFDYYEVLNCSIDDDQATIKKKGRAAIKKYHVDSQKNGKDDFAEEARKATIAYDTLSDPDERNLYDIDYKRRMSGNDSTKNDNTTSTYNSNYSQTNNANQNNSKNYSNQNTTYNYQQNNYTEQEKKEAKRQSIILLMEENKEKIPLINEAISEIILKAHLNQVNDNEYLQIYKIIVDSGYNLIDNFKILRDESIQLNMNNEYNQASEFIAQIGNMLREIPNTIYAAQEYVACELKKEELTNLSSELSNSVQELLLKLDSLIKKIEEDNFKIKHYKGTKSVFLQAIEKRKKEINKLISEAQKVSLNDIVVFLQQLLVYFEENVNLKMSELEYTFNEYVKRETNPPGYEFQKKLNFDKPSTNEYGGWSKFLG